MKKFLPPAFLLLLFIIVFVSPVQAHASVLDDFVNGVKSTVQSGVDGIKSFFNIDEKNKEFNVESKIELAPGGDINKNGQIDAGDTIKFFYTITNPTKESYKFATLNTNVNTKELNTISIVQGVLSLDISKDTILIPHLTIAPNQVQKISFTARMNFNKDNDQLISTEADLVDDKKSSIFKAKKQEVNAKKLDTESFNKFVHITK